MSNQTRITKKIEIEEMLSHLNLETVDATQTAFANSGIHISEATAFKWREMARDNLISELPKLLQEDDDAVGRNPVCSDAQIETGCCRRLAVKLCNLLCLRK